MTPEEIDAIIEAQLADLRPQVDAAIEQMNARTAALERQIAECEFEKLVCQNAVLGGVIPTAVEYIVDDVRELFEMRENALVVRNGETMPGDPLMPLSFEAWLEERRKQLPFLFRA